MMALVFALGMQTMIVELSLPRLLAPAFGNTLFCWTAAISEVLGALAIGYHIGGILSSGKAGKNLKLPWWLAAFAAGWVTFSAVAGDSVIGAISGLGMITGPLVGTLLIAVPPAGIGATVLPICVARLSERTASGRSAGQLYAFSTVGSVIGVLITGYLLLPTLGVTGSLFVAAAAVFIVFLTAKQFVFGSVGLGTIILLTVGLTSIPNATTLLDKSNGYHRIRVVSPDNDSQVRLLYLDSSLEGAVKLGSKNPGVRYQREGVRIAMQIRNLRRCFFLGGGSFSMPRFLKSNYPDVTIDVAEIDPDVVDVARSFMELSPGLNIFIGDARQVLAGRPEKYDLIMNDAFHGLRNIPFHLVTRQFHQMLAKKLAPKGIYAVNVMGSIENSRIVSSMIRTLKKDFKYINHVGTGNNEIQNRWLLSSNQPILIGESITSYPEKGVIFTDNHAPVEFLVMTDVLRERAIEAN